MSTFEVAFRSLTEGFGKNCMIFAVTLICAIPLGLIISFGSMSKFKPFKFLRQVSVDSVFFNRILKLIAEFAPIKFITRTFVWVIRGTPLMLQIFVVLYVPGLVFNIPLRERDLAVLVAFAINYAAYFSEIFRGGIEGIPKGQHEACQVLGMTKTQSFFRVILPQVVKRIIPPMGNEIITLVKDTSLARVVAVTEIIMCAERFTKQGLISPLFSTAIYFLVFNGVLTLLFGYIEKKLDYYKG